MKIMGNLIKESKSILFITHKLNEIMKIANRCTVLRRGKLMGTVDTSKTTKAELTRLMIGRDVEFTVSKSERKTADTILKIDGLNVISPVTKKHTVMDVSFEVRSGEIVCIAGIEGNGQSDLIYAITGITKIDSGIIELLKNNITYKSIRYRNDYGISHIPEDRHKYGLVLDYNLAKNLILKKYHKKDFHKFGFIKNSKIEEYADDLIKKYDIRSGQGFYTITRSMSGGNQQKAIIAREIDTNSDLLIAVQPTRGLDVGAIEYIHKQIIKQRDNGKGVLLVSLELDEVMSLSDRILVMYEGRIVAELDPNKTNDQELGFFMTGGT